MYSSGVNEPSSASYSIVWSYVIVFKTNVFPHSLSSVDTTLWLAKDRRRGIHD